MRDIVIISTADWDNPFWTNKQHVAEELGRTGNRVFYVESLGVRQPILSKSDLGRIWRRLKRGLTSPRHVRENVWVWSPLVVPFQRFAFVRTFNRWILNAMLRAWLAWFGFKPKVLWTYSVLTSSLVSLRGYRQVVYHAVDDVAAQPGMPKAVIEEDEAKLVKRADVVFVTARSLYERHKVLNASTYYFPNVCDFDHFSKAREADLAIPDDIAGFARPIIGFVGAISGYKLDFPLIEAMADARPHWSFVLIGKVGEGDPWTDASGLKRRANIHLLGGRPYAQLPAYLKGCDVAIIPCAQNDYTRAMFPMKFFEYLAAGLPVVSTRLPALREYTNVAIFRSGWEGMIEGIEDALQGRGAALGERLEVARENTYVARTAKMLGILDALRVAADGEARV